MTDAQIEAITKRWTDVAKLQAEKTATSQYSGAALAISDVLTLLQALAEKDRRIAELEAELQIRGPSGEPTLEEAMRKVMEVKQ